MAEDGIGGSFEKVEGAVVADGDRGYVFTMYFNVYDTPYLADPFEAAFKEMLAGTELTPASATD